MLTVWLRGLRAAVGPVLLALVGTGTTLLAPNPCELETAYHCARVVADPNRPTGRSLYLDDLRHSYVDLADPAHLEFGYIKDFAAGIDAAAPARGDLRVLHVGGGGMTMPRYLAATRPGSFHRVYEIDQGVVDLDVEELGAKLGDGLTGTDVRVRDARLGIRDEPADDYDVVIADAFGGVAVPWHLTTREVVADVRRVLTDDGLYLVNLIDFGPLDFVRAELRTIAAEFEHVVMLASAEKLAGREGGNFVVLASDRELPVGAIGAAAVRRRPDAAVLAPDKVAAFAGDAPLLTDEYAPVDQLVTTTAR